MKLALFDLNGVIADASHRLEGDHYSADPRKVVNDSVFPEGRAQMKAMLAQGWTVSFISGRPLLLEGVTKEWILRKNLPPSDLFLRPLHPPMTSVEFKVEKVSRFRAMDMWDEVIIFDDDEAVTQAVADAVGPESSYLCTWSHRVLVSLGK